MTNTKQLNALFQSAGFLRGARLLREAELRHLVQETELPPFEALASARALNDIEEIERARKNLKDVSWLPAFQRRVI